MKNKKKTLTAWVGIGLLVWSQFLPVSMLLAQSADSSQDSAGEASGSFSFSEAAFLLAETDEGSPDIKDFNPDENIQETQNTNLSPDLGLSGLLTEEETTENHEASDSANLSSEVNNQPAEDKIDDENAALQVSVLQEPENKTEAELSSDVNEDAEALTASVVSEETIETGDASSSALIENEINTNIIGGEYALAVINYLSSQESE